MSRLCVSDLMHSCGAATISPTTTLRGAAEMVLTTGLESLPVVDDAGSLVGLVAQTALVRELLASHGPEDDITRIMSRHVESARDTATVDSVLPLFRCASVSLVPVVNQQNQPVGLVHRQDVIQYLLRDSSSSTAASGNRQLAGRPHFLKQRPGVSQPRDSQP